jgi:hypothetical protein
MAYPEPAIIRPNPNIEGVERKPFSKRINQSSHRCSPPVIDLEAEEHHKACFPENRQTNAQKIPGNRQKNIAKKRDFLFKVIDYIFWQKRPS